MLSIAKKFKHYGSGNKLLSKYQNQEQLIAIVENVTGNRVYEEIIEPINEINRVLLSENRIPLFPASFLNKSISLKQMQHIFNTQLSKGSVLWHWIHSTPVEQRLFVKYEKKQGQGCEHFVTGATFYCTKCKDYICCEYCHQEVMSILNEPHMFNPDESIYCITCSYKNNIRSQKCENCNKELYNFICYNCKYSTFSGKLCQCNQTQQQILEDEDICPICQDQFDLLLKKSELLVCTHKIHHNCYIKYKHHSSNCPLCKKQLKLMSEQEYEKQKFISIYAITEVPLQSIGVFVRVKCSECGEEQVANQHPFGYICYKCDSINCQEIKSLEKTISQDEGSLAVKNQYEAIKQKGRLPIYPLILYQKNCIEMMEVVNYYINKYHKYFKSVQKKIYEQTKQNVSLETIFTKYCFLYDIDYVLGFAGLNLCYVRKIFPEPDKDGRPDNLDVYVIQAIVESREVIRLELPHTLQSMSIFQRPAWRKPDVSATIAKEINDITRRYDAKRDCEATRQTTLKAEAVVGNAMVKGKKADQENIFVDYAVYETRMMARRMKLKELYVNDLYRWKEQLAKQGFELKIDKTKWNCDIVE